MCDFFFIVLMVKLFILIIMGVNIGIFVINILVFMGEIIYCNDFWWVFVGVMVYDMFNWLFVIVLFFLEVVMG